MSLSKIGKEKIPSMSPEETLNENWQFKGPQPRSQIKFRFIFHLNFVWVFFFCSWASGAITIQSWWKNFLSLALFFSSPRQTPPANSHNLTLSLLQFIKSYHLLIFRSPSLYVPFMSRCEAGFSCDSSGSVRWGKKGEITRNDFVSLRNASPGY